MNKKYRETAGVTLVASKSGGDQEYFILEIPGTNKTVKIGRREGFLFKGATQYSAEELNKAYRSEFGEDLAAEALSQFFEQMVLLGALEEIQQPADVREETERASPARHEKVASATAKPGQSLQYRLFDPTKLLEATSYRFRWVENTRWLAFGLMLVGIPFLINLFPEFRNYLAENTRSFAWLLHFLLGLLVVNLVSVTVQALLVHRLGGEVREFGIKATFGLLRFYIDRSSIRKFSRTRQLQCHSAPLLMKLAVCLLAFLVWGMTFRQGADLSRFSFFLGLTAFGALVFTVNPLWQGDGYRWFSTFINKPRLREHSFLYLKLKLKSGSNVTTQSLKATDKWLYVLYAVGSIAYTLFLLYSVIIGAGIRLETQYSGTGIFLFLCMVAGMGYLISVRMKKRASRKGASLSAARSTRKSSVLSWKLLALLLLIATFFIPYHYETGGTFQVLPSKRALITSEIEGAVTDVFVKEGQVVSAGEKIAQLSEWRYQETFHAAESELKKAEAELKLLLMGSKAEDIQKASNQVDAQKIKADFALIQLERSKELAQKGFISTAAMDKDIKNYQNALAELEIARSNLASVTSQARQPEVEASKARISTLMHERELRKKELSKTDVFSSISGKVISSRPEFLKGNFLKKGDPLIEIEDSSIAKAEIEIPESDAGLVKLGQQARLRPWMAHGGEFVGSVEMIAPVATPREFGNVIRVVIQLDNRSGTLKSGMTGFGKIETNVMPAAQAFTRMLVRFVAIEMWSWLP